VTSALRLARFAVITLAALDQTLSDGAEVAEIDKYFIARWLNSYIPNAGFIVGEVTNIKVILLILRV
jgi:hypothetical protein